MRVATPSRPFVSRPARASTEKTVDDPPSSAAHFGPVSYRANSMGYCVCGRERADDGRRPFRSGLGTDIRTKARSTVFNVDGLRKIQRRPGIDISRASAVAGSMITAGVIRNGATYLSHHLRKNDYWTEGEKLVQGEWI